AWTSRGVCSAWCARSWCGSWKHSTTPEPACKALAWRCRSRLGDRWSDGHRGRRCLLELPALPFGVFAPTHLVELAQPLQFLHVALHAAHGELPLERIGADAPLQGAESGHRPPIGYGNRRQGRLFRGCTGRALLEAPFAIEGQRPEIEARLSR